MPMSAISEAFAKAQKENRAALIAYLCAGDPDLSTTNRLMVAASEAGADIIEVGVPFSDPTADGPAIQRASERSLSRGTTLRGVLDAVSTVREKTAVPIILFGYYNPILSYGEQRLVEDAKRAGVNGFLVVDLPPEDCDSLTTHIRANGLDYIPLLAPTSTEARIRLVAQVATSFVYYVSLTGVTGAQTDLKKAALRASDIRNKIEKPVAVGFGMSSPEDVASVSQYADGVVIGSAIVRRIEESKTPDAAVDSVKQFVASLATATRRNR